MSLEVQLLQQENYYRGGKIAFEFQLYPGEYQDILTIRNGRFHSLIVYCLSEAQKQREEDPQVVGKVYTIPWARRSSVRDPKPLWTPEAIANPENIYTDTTYTQPHVDRTYTPGRLIVAHCIGGIAAESMSAVTTPEILSSDFRPYC